MIFNIGILYPTWMNLYGEIGNIKALQYYLGRENIVKVDNIDDLGKTDLLKINLLYIGSGMDSGLQFAFNNIEKNNSKLKDYIENNGNILATGNSIYSLSSLGYYNIKVNENYYVSDVDAKLLANGVNVRGFQNTKFLLDGDYEEIFEIKNGYGNFEEGICSKKEGFRYKNFFATSLIGPLLAINDDFRNKFIEWVVKQ